LLEKIETLLKKAGLEKAKWEWETAKQPSK
jgi:hypothetical protein